MARVDAELKAKWVAALRSGEFKQAREVMKDTDGAMCCLGVLREIIEPGCEEINDDEGEFLPQRMWYVTGLSYEKQNTLTRMNDGSSFGNVKQHSFAEIADYIEAKL